MQPTRFAHRLYLSYFVEPIFKLKAEAEKAYAAILGKGSEVSGDLKASLDSQWTKAKGRQMEANAKATGDQAKVCLLI